MTSVVQTMNEETCSSNFSALHQSKPTGTPEALPPTTTMTPPSVNFDKNVVFERPSVALSGARPSLLKRESFSSPDLYGMASGGLRPVAEDDTNKNDGTPPRVMTFRDVVVARKKEEEEKKTDAPSDNLAGGSSSSVNTTPRKRIKPRIVVTNPVRRCAKSTGDLPSLLVVENAEDDAVGAVGDSDANEFYERKKHGQETRRNGQKMRPDEAKRRQITMAKKDQQRRRQQQSQQQQQQGRKK